MRTFMGLSHITNLSLSDNLIKRIDSLQFNDLTQLIDLNLSGNLLTLIDDNKVSCQLRFGHKQIDRSLNVDTFNSLTNYLDRNLDQVYRHLQSLQIHANLHHSYHAILF